MAMGGAFVAVADDPTSIYWNPAGLAKVNCLSLIAMGQSQGSGQWDNPTSVAPAYQFLGVVFPYDRFSIPGINNRTNTFGVGILMNSLDNVAYTTIDGSGELGTQDTLRDSETAYLFSYGIPITSGRDTIYAGATFKYITQSFSKIADASATGYDIDFGLMYGLGTLNFGLLVERGAILHWATGRTDTAPTTTKFGVSNLFPLSDRVSLLGAGDIVQRKNQPLSLNIGSEFRYASNLSVSFVTLRSAALRAGIDSFAIEDRYGYRDFINNNLNYTLGVGVDMLVMERRIEIDYAFGSYRLGGKSRFSINLYF
jgi:hypothetical protein